VTVANRLVVHSDTMGAPSTYAAHGHSGGTCIGPTGPGTGVANVPSAACLAGLDAKMDPTPGG